MPAPSLHLDGFIPYRLSVASNAVSNRIANSYRKRFGLKTAEWRIIAILAEKSSLTPQTLGDATRMDKITVSRASAALAERGLIYTSDNPNDRRSHFMALTDDGLSLYAEIVPAAKAMETELLARFSGEDRALLDALLRRIELAALEADAELI